jgi:iron-sulfur cluster repair protein YtfE (RIC family)
VEAGLLDELEAQHRQAEQVLSQLEKAEGEQGQRRLVEQLTTALAQHMQLEETQVYPELAKLDSDLAEEAEIEHGLARDGLAKLTTMIGQPGFGATVAMVQAGIAHHVEEEETEAFPKLRAALGLPGGSDEATKAELYEQAKQAGIEGRSSMSKEELSEAVETGS